MTGTAGRALHLLDVEYLGLGPKLTSRDLELVLRLLPAGGGPDAADLRLIDEATHVIDLTRYDRIVVASGDHIFGIVADAAHELGLEVWAAAYEFNLARSLAAAVDHVVDLTVGHALAA